MDDNTIRDVLAMLRAVEHDDPAGRAMLDDLDEQEIKSLALGLAIVAASAIQRGGASVDQYIDLMCSNLAANLDND